MKSGSSRLSAGRPKRIVRLRHVEIDPVDRAEASESSARNGFKIAPSPADRRNALSTSAAASFSSIAPTTAINSLNRAAIPRFAALMRSARLDAGERFGGVPSAGWP